MSRVRKKREEALRAEEASVVVKKSDMPEDMQKIAKDTVKKAFEEFKLEKVTCRLAVRPSHSSCCRKNSRDQWYLCGCSFVIA